MSKEDGGPAYPVTPTDRSGQIGSTEWGMSLRDWFAGMAMQAMMSDHNFREQLQSIGVAAYSYLIADDMLQERDK